MEIKKIIEQGNIVTVRVYTEKETEPMTSTELKVKEWFNQQEIEGFTFLKSFRDNSGVVTLFIDKKDLDKLLTLDTKKI